MNLSKPKRLTSRETEIMECLIKGLNIKLTDDRLRIAINTVKNHRKNIRQKLQASNAPEMVFKYLSQKA